MRLRNLLLNSLGIVALIIGQQQSALSQSTSFVELESAADSVLFKAKNYQNAYQLYNILFNTYSEDSTLSFFDRGDIRMKLALCLDYNERHQEARAAYKEAFQFAKSHDLMLLTIDYLVKVAQFYNHVNQANPSYYDSLKSQSYKVQNTFEKIVEVSTDSNGTHFVKIHAGKGLNLDDEFISIVGANIANVKEKREMLVIAEAELKSSDSLYNSYEIYYLDSSIENWMPRIGDMLVHETKCRDFSEDVVAKSYFEGIRYLDNYRDLPISLALLLTEDYEFYKPFILYSYKRQIEEIYELIEFDLEKDYPVLFDTIHKGIYKDRRPIDVMAKVSDFDIEQFMYYASEQWWVYTGLNSKISEFFATWLINFAPMSEVQFTRYLSNSVGEEQSSRVQKHAEDIRTDSLLISWFERTEKYAQDRKFRSALKLAILGETGSNVLGDTSMLIQFLSKQSDLYLELNQDQRATTSATKAHALLGRIGTNAAKVEMSRLSSSINSSSEPELVIQKGHSMPFELVVHPSGRFFYTAGWDGALKMWDFRSSLIIKEIRAHLDFIKFLKISDDGTTLLTTDDYGKLKLWNAYTLEPIWDYQHDFIIRGVDLNKDASKIAFVHADTMVYLVNTEDNYSIQELHKHKQGVVAVAFHKVKNVLLTGGKDSLIYSWKLEDNSIRGWYKELSVVWRIVPSPDGTYFATVCKDSSVGFWRYYKYRRVGRADTPQGELGDKTFYAVPCFSPDGKYFTYMNGLNPDKASVKFLNLATFEEQSFDSPHDNTVNQLCFHPSSRYLMSAGHDMKVIYWDLSNYVHKKVKNLSLVKNKPSAAPPLLVKFDTSGDHLITLIGADQYLMSGLNLKTGERKLYKKSFEVGDRNGYLNERTNEIQLLSYSGEYHSIPLEGAKKPPVLHSTAEFDSYLIGDSSQILYGFKNTDSTLMALNMANKDILFKRTLEGNKWGQIFSKDYALNSKEDYLLLAPGDEKIYEVDAYTGKIDSFCFGKKGKTEIIDVISTHLPDVFLIRTNKLVGLFNWKENKWNFKYKYDIDEVAYTTIELSPDGRYLALADVEPRLMVIDVQSGDVVFQNQDFGWFITSVAFHPYEDLIATTSEDYTLRVFELQSNKLLWKVYPQESGQMIVMNESGYYWADKNSLDGLAFRIKNSMYSVNQFDVQFNRPDRVLSAIPLADETYIRALELATNKRLERLGISQLKDELVLPNTLLVNRDQILDITRKNTVEIHVACTDYKAYLSALHVSVNGVEVNRDEFKLPELNEYEFKGIVKLNNDKNIIKIWCTNIYGIESLKETLEIHCKKSVKPNLFFGVISVADYLDSDYDLKYPVKDAKDLVQMFLDDSLVYDSIYVKRMFDEQVSIENMVELKAFYSRASIDDQVVLFISGHGLLDSNYDFYFGSYDMDFEDPAKRGISYESIEALLSDNKSRKRLLLMDACHSGEYDKSALPSNSSVVEEQMEFEAGGIISSGYKTKGGKTRKSKKQLGLQNSFNLMRELFADASSSNGIQVISAASGDSYALESDEWNNGVFTYALIQGMQGMASDRDENNNIYVSELRDYVIQEVYRLTDGRQRPTVRSENIEFDFRVW